MKLFYENTIILDGLRKLTAPSVADLKKVLSIIKDDVELTLYFYDVLDPGWVELLDEAGEFAGLREKETGMIGRYKAHYLKQCAETKAEAVLSIIEKNEAQDVNIQGTLLGAIVRMPEETAVKGVDLVVKYLSKREYKLWYGIGEIAAELMVKLVANHPDKAFEIAEALFDAWVSEEKTYGKDIVAKFSEYDYGKLMLEYYKKVWEAQPEQAIRVLVKILNRCLDALDKDKGDDASRYFGYGLELGDLNEIDMQHPGIKTVLVKGICEAGKVLIDKEPEKVSDLLDLLEGTKRVIFLRIAMYLLRFVKSGTEKERISKFVGNKEYFKEYNPCWYEHRRLLNDKFDDVSDKAKKAFVKWVAKPKLTDALIKKEEKWYRENNRPLPDFEKWENHAKAEELYLVREKFKDEYERYKQAAEVKNDSVLAPRKTVSEARFVSPMEGSPLSPEKMERMKTDEVVDYILDPKNYEIKKKPENWREPKDALVSTFQGDVKKRTLEYLRVDANKLERLKPEFLASFFYGAREGSFSEDGWKLLIELAAFVVEKKKKEEGYGNCFHAILDSLQVGFSREEDKIEFDEAMVRQFWGVVNTLVHFPVEDRSRFGEERDPMQMLCIQVPGQALELTILLAVVCKNNFGNYWENNLKPEMKKCWEFVLREIRDPGVNCMFGIEFARIYWLDCEWVEQNLDMILSDDLWDEIWGTYVSWGRPSPECFKFLVEKRIYGRAVQKIGENNRKYKFGKEPDEGLVEHLMIGYFNGWVGFEDEVLKKFFEKATAELRGKAARFLTTGFKSVNEEGGENKDRVAVRMREYWSKRLSAIKGNPKENEKEAVEFTGWVEDSVLPAKETLELLEQSLGGEKIGEMRNAKSFVEGISKLGKGNELLALRCLKLASADKSMHTPWERIQEPLVRFLEGIDELPENVRSAGREVADLYGRYNPDKFRGVWQKLNEAKRNEG